jgi:SAM-dependent methyltransferase
MTDFKKAFTFIYDNEIWGKGSGGGSSPQNNVQYIEYLAMFLKDKDIKSVVDFGCGDWQFSKYINWDGVKYVGIDVVESVIKENIKNYAKDNVYFFNAEAIGGFKADLLIVKDVFQHWYDKDIIAFLDAYKDNYKYILCTNTINGSWQHRQEKNVLTRPISHKTAPLNQYGFELAKLIDTNKNDLKEISILINKKP